jgi:hypothetical protein
MLANNNPTPEYIRGKKYKQGTIAASDLEDWMKRMAQIIPRGGRESEGQSIFLTKLINVHLGFKYVRVDLLLNFRN